MLALALVALVLAVPAPKVTAAPVQGSPVLVRITPRPGTLRLVCAVDKLRARTCRRTNRLKLAPGRHEITVWAIGRRGRASAKRSVSVVVPKPAPAGVEVGGQPVGIAAFDSALWVSDGSGGNVVRVDRSDTRGGGEDPGRRPAGRDRRERDGSLGLRLRHRRARADRSGPRRSGGPDRGRRAPDGDRLRHARRRLGRRSRRQVDSSRPDEQPGHEGGAASRPARRACSPSWT